MLRRYLDNFFAVVDLDREPERPRVIRLPSIESMRMKPYLDGPNRNAIPHRAEGRDCDEDDDG